MKILHISTSDRGGAGIAAKRLHLGLLEAGVDSKMLCQQVFDKNAPNIIEHPKLLPLTFIQRILYRLKIYKPAWAKKQNLLQNKKGNYEIYTFPFSDYRIDEHPAIKEADIINLHWVADFMDYSTFFKNVNKPVVWTLHDMNPFLGGFHYMNDVEHNKKNFNTLEQQLKNIKAEAYNAFKQLHIVTLSNYIKEISLKSELFSKYPHYLIPNGYDPILSNNVNKDCCKQVFNISPEKKVILFVSQNINNYRKGFDILLNVINKITIPEDYIFVAIGSNNSALANDKIMWVGEIHDHRLLEMAYKMAELFILPSREDNLPNTMLEAHHQGVPVIAFSKGGMKDVINALNGQIIEEYSTNALQASIQDSFSHKKVYNSNNIIKNAKDNYSIAKQVENYKQLYNAIFNA
jgi:glycosyltransferase involved in cell wall biosynthesis